MVFFRSHRQEPRHVLLDVGWWLVPGPKRPVQCFVLGYTEHRPHECTLWPALAGNPLCPEGLFRNDPEFRWSTTVKSPVGCFNVLPARQKRDVLERTPSHARDMDEPTTEYRTDRQPRVLDAPWPIDRGHLRLLGRAKADERRWDCALPRADMLMSRSLGSVENTCLRAFLRFFGSLESAWAHASFLWRTEGT